MTGKYEVIGKRPDGVRILAPRTKPEHFTSREIDRSIQRVINRDARSGRFVERADPKAVNGGKSRKRR